MAYEITDVTNDYDETIGLSEAKSYMRIDADYTADDDDIHDSLVSARQRLEQYLNIGLANRLVNLEWDGREIKLPLTPNGEIDSVSKGVDVLDSDKYTVSTGKNKRIVINDLQGCGLSYFYNRIDWTVEITPNSEAGTFPDIYECQYMTGYDADSLPKSLKMAILAEADYLFKLRGMPVSDVISPNASRLAAGYSKNLPI